MTTISFKIKNQFQTQIYFIFSIFPSSNKYFSFIKEFPHQKYFFLHQERFPLLRKFSTSKYFFFIKDFFHEHVFFLHQVSFPSAKKISTHKYLSLIKEVFHKQIFFLHQGNCEQTIYYKKYFNPPAGKKTIHT